MAHESDELDIVVGSIMTVSTDATTKQDQQTFNDEREMALLVSEQLHEAGIVFDLTTQSGTEVWSGSIESLGALYQLARLAIYLEKNKDIAQILKEGPVLPKDALDKAVTDVWDGKAETDFKHLVYLQGINSYYLPVDFPDPLWLPFENEAEEEDEAFFASAARLRSELSNMEQMLAQADVPDTSAAYRCLVTLRDAATESVSSGLPIIIW
jgi:hypothetical protein